MKDRKPRRTSPPAAVIPSPADGKASARVRASTATRFDTLLAGLGLCLLTLLAYANSFGSGFVLDNRGLLLQDPRIREATGKNVALIFQHTYWWPIGEAGVYRPLTTLSYLFNYAILGNAGSAAGYHWLNLLLHIGNVLLVFAVSRRLLGRLAPAAWLAALWAVYPPATESVTNMIGRSDLLAAAATLGGFLLYLKSTGAGARRWRWLAALALATAGGMESKESAVMIVAVIALYELAWPGRRQWRDLRYGLAATGIPIGLMLIQRAAVMAGTPPAQFPFTDNPIAGGDFWTGRLTALKVMGQSLAQAVWPWRLSFDYGYAQVPPGIAGPADGLALAAAVLAVVGMVMLWRWNRRAFFLAGFALLALLPTCNLLFPIGTIRADRFLYLPGFGVLGCVVMAVERLGSRLPWPRLAPALLLLGVAALAARTWARNADWRDELTLASADVNTCPHSFKLHRVLASSLFNADPTHANIDRVAREIDRSLAIVDPLPDLRSVPETYYLGGAVYLAKGERLRAAGGEGTEAVYRKARELLERCIRINEAYERQTIAAYGRLEPGMMGRTKPDAYRLLAAAEQRLGDLDAALQAAGEAQRLAPHKPELYNLIADLQLSRQQGNEAAVALMQGMLITSDPRLRTNLVRLYGSSEDPANCTLIPGPNGPAINPRCPIVLAHICAAAPGVLRALIDTGGRAQAADKKQAFIRDYHCAPEPLDKVAP